jgi:hypothetical protein
MNQRVSRDHIEAARTKLTRDLIHKSPAEFIDAVSGPVGGVPWAV